MNFPYNGSDKLMNRPEICQLPINSIQGYLVMCNRMCFGLGHCLTCFLRDIVPTDFLRIIISFLYNIVLEYFMIHIIAAVKSRNIGNILLFKAPINLTLFLSSFKYLVILNIYHFTPIPLQIQVTSSYFPCCSSK